MNMDLPIDTNFREPCDECPFRKNAAPGWLGPWTTDSILQAISHMPFPCHQTIPDDDDGMDEYDDSSDDNGNLESCAGAALYLNATQEISLCQITAEHQKALRPLSDVAHLFVIPSRAAFIQHHTRYAG